MSSVILRSNTLQTSPFTNAVINEVTVHATPAWLPALTDQWCHSCRAHK